MKLRDYQERLSNDAVEILHRKKIVYLAMEVRCGKTVTALETCKKYTNLTKENIQKLKQESKTLEANIQNLPLNYIQMEKEKLKSLLNGYLIEKEENLKALAIFQENEKNYEKRMQLTEILKELKMKLKKLIIEWENLSKKSKELKAVLSKEETLLMKLQNKAKSNGLEING